MDKQTSYEILSFFSDEENANTKVLPTVQSEEVDSATETSITFLSLDKIYPNPNQPRKNFDATSLQELAEIISTETGRQIGKSGINHYFIKVKKLVEKHKEKMS